MLTRGVLRLDADSKRGDIRFAPPVILSMDKGEGLFFFEFRRTSLGGSVVEEVEGEAGYMSGSLLVTEGGLE